MPDGKPFETNGDEYLKTLAVQEIVCEPASGGAVVGISCRMSPFSKDIGGVA
jgi:hypothetical protein